MRARDFLNTASQQIPTYEAEIILESVLDLKRTEILLNNPELSDEQTDLALETVRKRALGFPLQYILGHAEFLGNRYLVNPSVLIPRPETEFLVQYTRDRIKEFSASQNLVGAELGLGSGCISISLLVQFPHLMIQASEASTEALETALKNAENILGKSCTRFAFHNAEGQAFSFFKKFPPFDFIISNPPYLSFRDEIAADVLDHEPHSALFPEFGDNFFYQDFLKNADSIMKPKSEAFFEISHDRAEELFKLFQLKFPNTKLVSDLSGRPRILHAIR